MLLPLLGAAWLSTAAIADDPSAAAPPVVAPEPASAPPPGLDAVSAQIRLDEARRKYAQGDTEASRAILQELLSHQGPSLPAKVRQDALAYLGDILYSEEGAATAEPIFRALLDEAPKYVMDPFEHPEEVCRFFETLRPHRPIEVGVVKPPLPQPVKPPWLSMIPGGVYYFAKGKVGSGVAVAGVQVALAVSNLVLYQAHSQLDPHVKKGSAEDVTWHQLELATDLTAGAFYLSLIVPPAIEFTRWGSVPGGVASGAPQDRRTIGSVAIGLGPGAVAVTGRF